MSSRIFYTGEELGNAEISDGTWFAMYRLKTKGGIREILARKNGNLHACKVLPLVVSKKQAKNCALKGKCSLKRFLRVLAEHQLLSRAKVALLASDRPSTYFPGLNLKENWIIEAPGGVVEKGEKISAAGIRETLEELGLRQKQIVAYAVIHGPMPYDSGSHAEYVSMVVALCYGDIAPQKREGIIPEKCCTVPFAELRKFVKRRLRQGIAVEGHILAAAGHLSV